MSGINGLINDLIAIFNEEKKLYTDLYTLSDAKQKAIRAGDTVSLNKIIKDESGLIASIVRADGNRAAVAGKIAAMINVSPAEITVTHIAEHADSRQKAQLNVLKKELTRLATAQEIINDINRKLIETNLDYVEYMINIVSGATTLTNNYGKTGSHDGNEAVQRREGIIVEM